MLFRQTLVAAAFSVAIPVMAFAQDADAGSGTISRIVIPQAPGVPAIDHNPRVPGATGDARVLGDSSTMAGDRGATIEDRTGAQSTDGGGGD